MDPTGTTRIGRYLLNHSFMLPGLVSTVASTVTALLSISTVSPRPFTYTYVSSRPVVRRGKGAKDRVTLLPAPAQAALGRHLDRVRRQHIRDLQDGAGWVELPDAVSRKYPAAGRE